MPARDIIKVPALPETRGQIERVEAIGAARGVSFLSPADHKHSRAAVIRFGLALAAALPLQPTVATDDAELERLTRERDTLRAELDALRGTVSPLVASGRRLAAARAAAGLTTTQLARHLGFGDPASIRHKEAGKQALGGVVEAWIAEQGSVAA